MPDFDLVTEMAHIYEISIEEILSGERKNNMIDREKEEAMVKVSKYETDEKMRFAKRLRVLLIIALILHLLCTILRWTGKADFEAAASFLMGAVFGLLALSILATTRYSAKIRAFKLRLLKRKKEE